MGSPLSRVGGCCRLPASAWATSFDSFPFCSAINCLSLLFSLPWQSNGRLMFYLFSPKRYIRISQYSYIDAARRPLFCLGRTINHLKNGSTAQCSAHVLLLLPIEERFAIFLSLNQTAGRIEKATDPRACPPFFLLGRQDARYLCRNNWCNRCPITLRLSGFARNFLKSFFFCSL